MVCAQMKYKKLFDIPPVVKLLTWAYGLTDIQVTILVLLVNRLGTFPAEIEG